MIAHSKPRPNTEESNPFVQMLERMTALTRHWGDGLAPSGNGSDAITDFRRSFDKARAIWGEAAERQFEIVAKAQRRVLENLAAIGDARSPQDAWARQVDILAILADAGAEYSAIWANCCRDVSDQYASATQKADARENRADTTAKVGRASEAAKVSPRSHAAPH
jgi:hypothetical protein